MCAGLMCAHVKSSDVLGLTLVPSSAVKGTLKVYIAGRVAHGNYRRVSLTYLVAVRHV